MLALVQSLRQPTLKPLLEGIDITLESAVARHRMRAELQAPCCSRLFYRDGRGKSTRLLDELPQPDFETCLHFRHAGNDCPVQSDDEFRHSGSNARDHAVATRSKRRRGNGVIPDD